MENACCAHMRVSYRTRVSRPGLVVEAWWECDSDCGKRFSPDATPPEIDRAGENYRKAIADFNRAVEAFDKVVFPTLTADAPPEEGCEVCIPDHEYFRCPQCGHEPVPTLSRYAHPEDAPSRIPLETVLKQDKVIEIDEDGKVHLPEDAPGGPTDAAYEAADKAWMEWLRAGRGTGFESVRFAIRAAYAVDALDRLKGDET